MSFDFESALNNYKERLNSVKENAELLKNSKTPEEALRNASEFIATPLGLELLRSGLSKRFGKKAVQKAVEKLQKDGPGETGNTQETSIDKAMAEAESKAGTEAQTETSVDQAIADQADTAVNDTTGEISGNLANKVLTSSSARSALRRSVVSKLRNLGEDETADSLENAEPGATDKAIELLRGAGDDESNELLSSIDATQQALTPAAQESDVSESLANKILTNKSVVKGLRSRVTQKLRDIGKDDLADDIEQNVEGSGKNAIEGLRSAGEDDLADGLEQTRNALKLSQVVEDPETFKSFIQNQGDLGEVDDLEQARTAVQSALSSGDLEDQVVSVGTKAATAVGKTVESELSDNVQTLQKAGLGIRSALKSAAGRTAKQLAKVGEKDAEKLAEKGGEDATEDVAEDLAEDAPETDGLSLLAAGGVALIGGIINALAPHHGHEDYKPPPNLSSPAIQVGLGASGTA